LTKLFNIVAQMGLTTEQVCKITGLHKRQAIRLINYGVQDIRVAKRLAKKFMLPDYRLILENNTGGFDD